VLKCLHRKATYLGSQREPGYGVKALRLRLVHAVRVYTLYECIRCTSVYKHMLVAQAKCSLTQQWGNNRTLEASNVIGLAPFFLPCARLCRKFRQGHPAPYSSPPFSRAAYELLKGIVARSVVTSLNRRSISQLESRIYFASLWHIVRILTSKHLPQYHHQYGARPARLKQSRGRPSRRYQRTRVCFDIYSEATCRCREHGKRSEGA